MEIIHHCIILHYYTCCFNATMHSIRYFYFEKTGCFFIRLVSNLCYMLMTINYQRTRFLVKPGGACLVSYNCFFSENVSICACMCVCVCVCPPPRLLITSGTTCTSYDWVNLLYSFYIAVVISIISGRDLSIDAHHR